MIKITDKHNCCGCSACVQACPKQCISMQQDAEGFLYPYVDTLTCIDCGLCEKVCPVLNISSSREPLECYVAKNPNINIRWDSSSGGIFTMLAETIIKNHGVVFGAAFNEKWQVVHSYTETKEGLSQFRGSKYVQSIIGKTYIEAETFLKSGRNVLFSGTPCQIAGLRKFLRKDYDNLFTVDFICHGVPSPGVFRWYLQEEINKYANQKGSGRNSVSFSPIHSIPKEDVHLPEGLWIKDIRFRDKREGWKKYSFVLTLAEATADGKQNTVSLSTNKDENLFLQGFLNDLYLRPSCHQCPIKCFRSGSDITIADAWGIWKLGDVDDSGVSMYIAHTDCSKDILKKSMIRPSNIIEKEFIVENNPAAYISTEEKESRSQFFNKMNKANMDLSKLITSSLPRISFFDKIVWSMNRRLNKLIKLGE